MATHFPVPIRRFFPVAWFVLAGLWAAGSIALAGAQTDPSVDLPEQLRGVPVSDAFVAGDGEPIGTVQTLEGSLIVRHGQAPSAYRASAGDRICLHDILFTLAGARARLSLATGDVVTLGENSHISVDQFEDDRSAGSKRSGFSLLTGKAMFYALRLFRYRTIEAAVHTPTAVVGVRGTKFGVKVDNFGAALSSARSVYLADASGGAWPGLLAQNAPGAQSRTTVYGFDGQVSVTSTVDNTTRNVGAGQNVTAGPEGFGPVTMTPPMEAGQFVSDTEAPPPADDGGETEDGGGEESGEAGAGADADPAVLDATGDPAATDLGANAADISQDSTAAGIAGAAATVVSGARTGYFAALLTRHDGVFNLADIYANSSRSDFNSAAVAGTSIVDSGGTITAAGTADIGATTTPYITRIKTQAGGPYDSGDLGSARQMDNPENTPGWPAEDRLGENSYMEWGFWRMSRWVPQSVGPFFAITDRAYYIFGQATPDAAAAGIVGTYGGSAWGTYFSGTGGKDMVGGFQCGINVPDKTVTHFNLSVQDAAHTVFASINNASGAFIGASGEFRITGGDFQLNGAAAASDRRFCAGSLFGPSGEYVGGAWAMDAAGGNNAAVGIFQGAKGAATSVPAIAPGLPSVPAPAP